MGKSSNNLDKSFDNNNENIKSIERLPQVKISDLSIILYLHHCSEGIIRHYSWPYTSYYQIHICFENYDCKSLSQ